MSTKLADYLSRNSISQNAFAGSIDSTQATVSRLASGKMEPSLSLAIQIERATGGAVPANAWLEKEKRPA